MSRPGHAGEADETSKTQRARVDDLPRFNRRWFLIGGVGSAGVGLALGLKIPSGRVEVVRTADGTPEVNAWVLIRADESVVIRIARCEMGQGTMTGLAQLVAEELECDWSKVSTEFPTPGQNFMRKRVWGAFFTAGSSGIRASQLAMRKAGATARAMLIQAAANHWKVHPADCAAAGGVITHVTSGRRTTFGQMAEAAARLDPPWYVPLKDPKDWKIAGKPLKRLDTAPKVTGETVYGLDLRLPGMVCAAIKDCPVFGGRLKSFDAAQIKTMKGVKEVLQVGISAVAVVADHWWNARTALEALPITWDQGADVRVSSASVSGLLDSGLGAEQAFIGHQRGDAKEAITAAARKIEAVYGYPYQHHATMEPMNATVLYTEDRCEIWTATQDAEVTLAATAQASGLSAAKCEVHRMPMGGGFGRRTAIDYVQQAVTIAKRIPGTPVKLIWSREEDMTHGRYHPITKAKMVGAFDANGRLSGLHMRISGQSIVRSDTDRMIFQGMNAGGAEDAIGYAIPNLLIDYAMRNTHVPAHIWRGVNNNQNAMYLECFIDELAHAAGQDSLEFRRQLMLNHPKHLAVLDAVANRVSWGTPAPRGIYRGLAQHMSYGSYAAACAEVSMIEGRTLKIHRIIAALDCGHAVNPAQIERQIAGSVAFGLSALLYGECTIKEGRIEQENFDTYDVIRLADMPHVETIIMPSRGFWGGVGEPAVVVAGPAVLNAIFAATGKRIRSIPLKNHNLGTEMGSERRSGNDPRG